MAYFVMPAPVERGRRTFSSQSLWLALCGAWLAVVFAVDIVVDRQGHAPVVLVGLVIGAPLLASIRLDARRTALVGLVSILAGAALWRINAMPVGADSFARLAALMCACGFGVLAAHRREQLQSLSDQRRLSAARAQFLAGATTELVSSLDYAQTLAQVAHVAVPALVDRCVIDLEEGREVRRVAEVGAAAGGTAIAVPIVWQDARSGRSRSPTGRAHASLTDEDRTLVVDLAARAARAIEHARVNLERDHIARTLQTSLLPPALPQAPGLDLAARYRAARGGAEVGGDFYDCFPLGDGEWVALVGDVQARASRPRPSRASSTTACARSPCSTSPPRACSSSSTKSCCAGARGAAAGSARSRSCGWSSAVTAHSTRPSPWPATPNPWCGARTGTWSRSAGTAR